MTASPVASRPQTANVTFPAENIFGHHSRVQWMAGWLGPEDRIAEVGCGTGYRITLPLVKWGYQVVGIDRDAPSIEYGQELMVAAGLPRETIQQGDLDDLPFVPTAVIVSEVLEHVPTPELPQLLGAVDGALAPGGLLLVTVPNGYGYFELESFCYHKLRLGRLLEWSGATRAWPRVKRVLYSGETRNRALSSLSSAPHVQRFTYRSIRRLLEGSGFEVQGATGSVLFCGPICDLLFSGSVSLQYWNRRLGRRLPARASGFYVVARKRSGHLESSGTPT